MNFSRRHGDQKRLRKVTVVLATMAWCLSIADGFAERILTPEVAETLKGSFAKLEAPWRVENARIEGPRVDIELCNEACFDIVLTDPSIGCEGTVVGHWCLQGPAEAVTVTGKALADGPDDEVWTTPASASHEGPIEDPPPARPMDTAGLGYALGFLLLPILAGWVFAWLILRNRSAPKNPGRILAVAFLLAVGSPFLMPVYVADLVIWDRIIIGALVVVGAAFGGRLCRPQMAAMVFGSVLAAFLGEVLVRLLGPTPPVFAPAVEQRLLFNQGLHLVDYTPHREALFPKRYPEVLEQRLRPRDPGQPLILHVGDSMVAGSLAEAEDSFSDQLNLTDRTRVHINAGVAATGPDYHLTVATRWSEIIDPTTVILHLFTGNDLSDVAHAFGFCEGLLYVRDGDRLIDNCKEPIDVTALSALSGRRTPCPYLLRVLGNTSALAGHSCAILQRGYDLLEISSTDREAWVYAVLAEAKRRFAAADVELVIAIIPYRLALEDPTTGEESRHMREVVLDACRDLDLRVLDSWDPMQDAVNEHGSERWFINNPPGDIHFSREGHRFYAEWLLPQLN